MVVLALSASWRFNWRMTYEIAVSSEVDQPGLGEDALARLVGRALSMEGVAEGAAVSVVLTGDATVHELNRAYRGVDRPTDVLSFGLSEMALPSQEGPAPEADGFVLPPESGLQVGEVIVSQETAVRQAAAHGRALDHELAHLVVHGVLHLLGHDHAQPEQERVMRGREDAILTAEGFPPGTVGWSHPDE